MLSSITPLGERGRGTVWSRTVGSLVVASTLGGALVGAMAGLLGMLLNVPATLSLLILGALTLLGVAADLGWSPLRIPTTTRQVDRKWLDVYRGWVYGGAFGFQLGLGVVTVVNASAIYLVIVAATLAHDFPTAILLGATFGFLRGSSLLLAWRIRDPIALYQWHESMSGVYPGLRRVFLTLQLGIAASLLALVAASF